MTRHKGFQDQLNFPSSCPGPLISKKIVQTQEFQQRHTPISIPQQHPPAFRISTRKHILGNGPNLSGPSRRGLGSADHTFWKKIRSAHARNAKKLTWLQVSSHTPNSDKTRFFHQKVAKFNETFHWAPGQNFSKPERGALNRLRSSYDFL